MKAPVNSTLALGLIAVVMIIGMEKMNESALAETHKDGFAAGYALGQSDIAQTMAKQVTDKTCMSWWFQGDSERVGKAIQKVSFK